MLRRIRVPLVTALVAVAVTTGVAVGVLLADPGDRPSEALEGFDTGGPKSVVSAEEVPSDNATPSFAPTREVRLSSSTPRVIDEPSLWPVLVGKNLSTLVEDAPVAFYGTVRAVELIPNDGQESAASWYTLATVEVDRWITDELESASAFVYVRQPGGASEDVVISAEGDPLMEPGQRFLFVVGGPYPVDEGTGTSVEFFSGVPFGRSPSSPGGCRESTPCGRTWVL